MHPGLRVIHTYTCIIIVPAIPDSLHLTSDPETDFVEIGQIVTLTCEVTSRPQAKLKWILVLVWVYIVKGLLLCL